MRILADVDRAAAPLREAEEGFPLRVGARPFAFMAAVSVLIAAAYYSWGMVVASPDWFQVDMRIYLDATRTMLEGGDLYSAEPPFNYPPFAAFVFAPLVPLGSIAASVPWYLAKLTCLQLVVWWYLQHRGLSVRRRAAVTAAAALLLPVFMEPLSHGFSTGQVNLLLLFLVLVDLVRPQNSRWRGVLTGIAAGIKIVPALFIVYLVVSRQFRAAGMACASLGATIVAGFLVLPGTAWTYWTSVLWATDRVHEHPASPLNQSIMGVVARFAHSEDVRLAWFALAACFTLAALVVAAGHHRRGASLEALTLVGLAVPMATPHAWTHHWAWLLPAVLLLFTWGRGSAWRMGIAVFLILLTVARTYLAASLASGGDVWTHVGSLDMSAFEQLLAAPLVIFAVAFTAISALKLREPTGPARAAAGSAGHEEGSWTAR
ncbi:glycosyltransferase 87 family protein [Streptomonospora algeriensis]|uniref:Glycosyltransferase 87 family protein n=1 Tax=Streptomonospora algeriensis TaxID=995084 RepID=A0ABW3B9H3_9ACTN